MINKCFITPNDIHIDLAIIATFLVIYLVYMRRSLKANGEKYNKVQKIMVKVIGCILTLNGLVILSVALAKRIFKFN